MKIEQSWLDQVKIESPDVHLIDGQNFQEHPRTIIISDDLEPQDLVQSFVQKKALHWLQKNECSFSEDLNCLSRIVQDKNRFFVEGAKSLLLDPTDSHRFRFTGPPDKQVLKEGIENFVKKIGSQSVLEASESVTEELYMNAVIDAPREAQRLGYRDKAEYRPGEASELEMYLNKNRLVIAVRDPFGALNAHKFIERMNEVYSRGAGQAMNRGDGGAGLGCVILFENSVSLFLGVVKGQTTLVACVIPVGKSNRQRAVMKKSLHRIEI